MHFTNIRCCSKSCLTIIGTLFLSTLIGCGLFDDHPEYNINDAQAMGIVNVLDARPTPNLFFPQADSIWMVDRNNGLLFSDDLGSSWTTIKHPAESTIITIHIADSEKLILLGDSEGYLHTSVDKGASWSKKDLIKIFAGEKIDRDDVRWQDLTTQDGKHLVLNANCRLFVSSDYGQNWTDLSKDILSLDDDLCVEYPFFNDQQVLTHAAVINWGPGWSSKFYLYKTDDAGNSWRIACPPTVIAQLEGGYPTCPDEEVAPFKYQRYFEVSESTRRQFESVEDRVREALDSIRNKGAIPEMNPELLASMIREEEVSVSGDKLWHSKQGWVTYSEDDGKTWNNVFTPKDTPSATSSVSHASDDPDAWYESIAVGTGFKLESGFMVGFSAGGTVVSNNANAWTAAQSDSGELIEKLLLGDDRTKSIAITNNEILYSDSAAHNWATLQSFDSDIKRAVRVRDSIWILTGERYPDTAHISDDLGQSWTSILIPETDYDIQEMHCALLSCVFLAGEELVYLSKSDTNEFTASKQNIAIESNVEDEIFCCNRNLVWSETASKIWLTHLTGIVYSSSDKGESWQAVTNEPSEEIELSQIAESRNVLMFEKHLDFTRNYYSVQQLVNGDWTEISALPADYEEWIYWGNAVCWLNENEGLLALTSNEYYVTNDAGQTWYSLELPSDPDGDGSCIRWETHLEVDNKIVEFI